MMRDKKFEQFLLEMKRYPPSLCTPGLEDSQKDSTVKKNDAAQKKEPTQKSESKVVTNMNDPRIKAMDPATQAQIAAGFITPVEMPNGNLALRRRSPPRP